LKLSKRQLLTFISSMLIVLLGLVSFNGSKAEAANQNIVDPIQTYTYPEMVRDIKKIAEAYPNAVRYKVIGKSEYGRDIYAVGIGNGSANVYIDGSHHAREWLTTNLNMYMINKYAHFYENNYNLDNYNVRNVLNKTTLWFVPMVNPDGVTLQQSGLSAFPKKDHAALIKMNDGKTNFTRWKANGKGIDLNRQYDADWENIWFNTGKPSWKNYKGKAPETARETKAVVNFIYSIDPEMAVTYHSAGKILYWNFHQQSSEYYRDLAYASELNELTNYSLVRPTPNPSGGGLSDWFVIEFKRPGFTPEIGNYPGERHLPLSEFNKTWQENRLVGLYVASEGYKLYTKRLSESVKEVNLVINDEKVSLSPSAILLNNRTMVPIRGVFENLGASVSYNASTKSVTVKKADTTVKVKIGSPTAYVNSKKVELDTSPIILKGRTMIPLRFVSEAIGASVKWNTAERTAYITLSEQAQNPETIKSNSVNIIIDGEEQSFNPEAVVQNGTTIVPLRDILKNENPTYSWENGRLKVEFAENTIFMKNGTDTVEVNGETINLGTSITSINGRTMVPLVLLMDILQWDWEWDSATWTVTIAKPSTEATTIIEDVTDKGTVTPDTDDSVEQTPRQEAAPLENEKDEENVVDETTSYSLPETDIEVENIETETINTKQE
jgi:murein tripeptide amidase MpaA/phage baseplate assembly protein gpV